ncbi:low molecular weight protein arginine phosphatase [Candidatus Bathyarchaeota archaeon]|nr:MAG: low molecular weight protein arginine phosphatase [Candidatus Bathyarchaeota archaeon]
MKVLFVCDGNICRSPMAEALMRQTLADRNVNGIEVSSSGLVASPWSVAHAQLRRVLGSAYQIVENRPSQPLTQELVDRSNLILGMENRHVRQILERYPGSQGRVDKITSYAGRDGEVKDFPDSGYGDVFAWLRHCHSIMLPCIGTIADRLVRGRDNESVASGKTGKVD